jgi:NAD(P)H-hydrate epimerase
MGFGDPYRSRHRKEQCGGKHIELLPYRVLGSAYRGCGRIEHPVQTDHRKGGKNATPAERIKLLAEVLPAGTILTPHKKELSRLIGVSLAELSLCLWSAAEGCTAGNDLIFVKKDVRSIVSFGNSNYINVTGNDGMATGGSGDVLGGIIAGLIAQGESRKAAAMTGCYIHGLAGNLAAEKTGARSMLAGDILEALPHVLNSNTDRKEIR